jgi:hypothetical protein
VSPRRWPCLTRLLEWLHELVLLSLFFSVRPVDALAAELFERALAQSATVHHLVQALEASDVIVHVTTARQMPPGIGGMTRFVTSRGGYRYVRITIAGDLPWQARVALLAHELQHASEIAQSGAGDIGGLRALFGRSGLTEGTFFETRMAIAIERDVRRELRSPRLAPTPPQRVQSRER